MSERVALQVIGHVRNGRDSAHDSDWGHVESRIELDAAFAAGLEGLEQFSHALVVFHMHLDPDREPATLRRRPRGRDDMPLVGVFAQRGRMRPNPIGVTAVEGTPVLDLKPYAPVFDRRDDARVPDWLDRLMQGYF